MKYTLTRTSVTLLALLLLAAGQRVAAQGYYTLTNGHLYWYEAPGWDPGTEWSAEKVGTDNHVWPDQQTELAVDRSNSWSEIHLIDDNPNNITEITEMGQYYVRLVIDKDASDHYSGGHIEAVATGFSTKEKTAAGALVSVSGGTDDEFDEYCVWQRTGNTGYYYQEYADPTTGKSYRFYLVGTPGLANPTVEMIEVGDKFESNYWYNWDFGAAVAQIDVRNGKQDESDHWLYLDNPADYGETGAVAWKMTTTHCYERPDYIQFSSFAGTDFYSETNQANRTYYYAQDNKRRGLAAQFMPVQVNVVARHVESLPAGKGLTGASATLTTGDHAAVRVGLQRNGAVSYAAGAPERLMAFGDEATLTATVTDGGTVPVVDRYTEYTAERYRYGINTDYTKRTANEFKSAGVAIEKTYYHWADGTWNADAPAATNVTLTKKSVSLALERRSQRYLETVGTADGSITLRCIDQPDQPFDARVIVTTQFENDITVVDTIVLPLSTERELAPMPTVQRSGVEAPLVAGWVFGGGRMAGVGGSTSVTVHSADTIQCVYGGNDIAGWVQGAGGTHVYIGTKQTNATHPVRVGYVYGGGCGYYRYDNLYFPVDNEADRLAANDAYAAVPRKGVSEGSYCFKGKVYPWDAYKVGSEWKMPDGSAATPVEDHEFTYLFPGEPGACTLLDFMTCEDGSHGDGTVPYAQTSHIRVGASGHAGNDYVVVDSLFGGAENSFIGAVHDKLSSSDATIDMYGGTVYALFGGNNYGGSVAPTAYTEVNIHGTKTTADATKLRNLPYSGYGRSFGIRHLYGGGNLVRSAHAEVNITGGMVDSCFLGGNRATVEHPIGTVNCTGADFIYSNPSLDALTANGGQLNLTAITDEAWNTLQQQNPGTYTSANSLVNVRVLFGGNNKATMNSLSNVILTSGGIGSVYGGGNQGDMNNATPYTDARYRQFVVKEAFTSYVVGEELDGDTYDGLTDEEKAKCDTKLNLRDLVNSAFAGWKWNATHDDKFGSLIYTPADSRVIVENVYGGCRMANVRHSSGVWLRGGCFGYVQGGNDISGDVGSEEPNGGSYLVVSENAIVLEDAYGGSDGYYHCTEDGYYVSRDEAVTNYSGEEYDPYDEYLGLLSPTQNNSNLYIKGGHVLFSAYGGGVMTSIGEAETGTQRIYLNEHADEYWDGSAWTTDPAQAIYGKNRPGIRPLKVEAGEKKGTIHFQLSGDATIGSKYYHYNANESEALSHRPQWRKAGDPAIDGAMTGRERRTALATSRKSHPTDDDYDVLANHDGNVYGGGYLSVLSGLSYFYVNGSPTVYGSLFAGNDCLGSIEGFGAYSEVADLSDRGTIAASDGTTLLNMYNSADGTYTSNYKTYVRIDGTPRITCVYGSGNGAYNYGSEGLSTYRPEYSDMEPVCMDASSTITPGPYQSSTLVDIHTAGGYIDTVFGGGNGVGVRQSAKILLNCTVDEQETAIASRFSASDKRLVRTIFGGNNRDNMTQCVPEIVLLKGTVGTIFGGGNAGGMSYLHYHPNDLCGHQVDSVSTHITIDNATATITDSVFGGCRMADVAGKAFIEVNAGTVNTLFGGNDISGIVYGNTRIDVSGGTINEIYGGSNGKYEYSYVNPGFNVYDFGHADDANYLVTAGAGNKPYVDSTAVNLYGGTIENNVFGGGNFGPCVATLVDVNDRVNVTDKSCKLAAGTTLELVIHGDVYGGGKGNAEDLNATRRGNVIKPTGNELFNTKRQGTSHVKLQHATTMTNASGNATAYGGGRGGDVVNTYITVYPTWDATVNNLYGGCWGSDVYGTAHVVVNADESKLAASDNNIDYVYGGNDFTGNVYRTEVTVDGGRIGTLYGGGNGNGYTSDYTAAPYDGNYAGSSEPRALTRPNVEYTVVDFNDGTMTGNLYGGGREGTTLVYSKNADGTYATTANGRKQPYVTLTTPATAGAYSDISKYSHTLVNVHGGTFMQNIFAGAQGSSTTGQLVFGLKMLNMDGGYVYQSVYGGSESVNDGYPGECVDKSTTTMRPSSIMNLAGGTVTNNVYGGGYLGEVYGSVYVNAGVEAIENCVVWNKTVGGTSDAYLMFKPGYTYTVGTDTYHGYVDALSAHEVQLLSSIYAGANWGNNTGNADFSKAGFHGGESRIFIDGTGYKTFMNDDEDALDQMNIGKSVIGSGTSAEGGDIYRRIDIHHYGAINPITCKPTRQLRAIQRADALYLDNTAIDYTGSTDAISAYLSNQVTINRVDSINCVGYNVIDVDATISNIKAVNYYKDNFDEAEPHGEIWPYYGKDLTLTDRLTLKAAATTCAEDPSICSQLGQMDRTEAYGNAKALTAFLMNNGINVDFFYHNTVTNQQEYAPVKGFAYILAEPNTNAVISALSKYDEGSGTHWADGTVEYGGFMPTCQDSASTFTASGTYNEKLEWTFDPSNTAAEYPYFNYSTNYRVWSIGKGVRRRYAVITAHAEPNKLPTKNQVLNPNVSSADETPVTLDSLAIAYAGLELPPTTPGHYYKISPNTGVTIDDVNDEMRLVTNAWNPYKTGTVAGEWDINSKLDHLHQAEGKGGWDGPRDGMNEHDILANVGTHFGLLMSSNTTKFNSGMPMTSSDDTKGLTVLSGSQTVNQLNNFKTHLVGDENYTTPILDLFLTYAPHFGNTLIGTVTFTLNECVEAPVRNSSKKSILKLKADKTIYTDGSGNVEIASEFADKFDISKVDGVPYLVSKVEYDDGCGNHVVAGKYIDANGCLVDDEARVAAIYDSSLNSDIWVEVTINTVLEKFSDIKYDLLAMYNEGRSNKFVRKTILPATLEPRDIYLKAIEWGPTDVETGSAGAGLGEYTSTWTDPSDPTYYFNLTKDETKIPNTTNIFSIRIQPVDDVSTSLTTSEGWRNISGDMAERRDVLDLAGKDNNVYNTSGGLVSDPDEISLTSLTNPNGKLIGTLDGRGESGIDIELIYDGSQVYSDIPKKGYVGKVVLHMVSYKAGETTNPNEFDIIAYVKTRAHGDTIYVASADKYYYNDYDSVQNAGTGKYEKVKEGGLYRYATHTEPDGTPVADGGRPYYEAFDFTNETLIEKLKDAGTTPGKRPAHYINSLYRALQSDIYQEGDVVAVLDQVNVPAGTTLRIRGYEYEPLQIIRYYGHHHDAPGEKNVYRGTMIDVSGTDATLNAVCVDFRGSSTGKLEEGAGSTAYTKHQKGDAAGYLKYADTNVAFGPVLSVHNHGTIQLRNGSLVEDNFNAYNGTDSKLYGAINVSDNGTLQLMNNVTVRHNLSAVAGMTSTSFGTKYTDGLTDDASHYPLNGAVYVDNGTVLLKESNNATEVNIQKNILIDATHTASPATATANTQYWEEHKLDAADTILHWDFNPNVLDGKQKANVYLTRTEKSDHSHLDDAQSDMIRFEAPIPEKWRIGVRKWFPGINERDTIRIAFEPNGTDLTNAYLNGNFTSDDDYFVFANSGVHDEFIYLQRCATFRQQQVGGSFPAYAKGPVDHLNELVPADVLDYTAYVDGLCPIGGDTITYRVQGGFFPYTYTWTLGADPLTADNVRTYTTPYKNKEVVSRAKPANGYNYDYHNSGVLDRLVTSSVDMNRTTDKTLTYNVSAVDITGNCVLKKQVEVKLTMNTPAGITDKVVRTVTDPDEWKVTEKPNSEVQTAKCTRYFPGVKITPVVWTSGGAITVKALTDDPTIYTITDDVNTLISSDAYFCQGDQLRLITTPQPSSCPSEFIMWDFDPYYSNDVIYTVPAQDAVVVAYYAPGACGEQYWIEHIDNTVKGKVYYDDNEDYTTKPAGYSFVVTHHGDVHIYDEDALAWFISSVNGLNGTQAKPYYFNTVYLHQKSGGYDMSGYLWTPVGTVQHPFQGRLRGVAAADAATEALTGTGDDSYVLIKNIMVNEPNADYAGFFGHMEKATVESIRLESALVRGDQYVGTLAADSKESHITHVKVGTAEADNVPSDSKVTHTTTLLTTRYVSGGMLGRTEKDVVSDGVAEAKFVGTAVYSGGMVGYGNGTDVLNSMTRNTSLLNALYSGGIAGYLEGKGAPVGLFRRQKGTDGMASVMNNYVDYSSTGANERVGGLVGYAKNVVMQNNYVYGQLDATDAAGAVAGLADQGTKAMYNYYATGSAHAAAGQTRADASVDETHAFSGSGNQVHLAEKSYGSDNLTRSLNLWVRDNGSQYRTWRSDLEHTNHGYPQFGTPDLIPVSATVVVDGCDSVEWDGTVYYFDAEAESHVVDSLLMVDSTAHLVIRVHHSTREQYSDSTTLGTDYEGHGFSFSAAETELLRATIREYGHATITLTDTLQSISGCDSIVCLTLTVNDDGSAVDIDDEPQPQRRPDIKVYPNPTTSRVTVETEGIRHVELYDSEGRRLQDYTTDQRDRLQIDLSDYASGAYYLRVHTDYEITIQKLIKK